MDPALGRPLLPTGTKSSSRPLPPLDVVHGAHRLHLPSTSQCGLRSSRPLILLHRRHSRRPLRRRRSAPPPLLQRRTPYLGRPRRIQALGRTHRRHHLHSCKRIPASCNLHPAKVKFAVRQGEDRSRVVCRANCRVGDVATGVGVLPGL